MYDLGTFVGAVAYVADEVMPGVAEGYTGPFHPVLIAFATVDGDDQPCEPRRFRITTDFEFHTEDVRKAVAQALRMALAEIGAIGFVMLFETSATGLPGERVVLRLDHVKGSATWIAEVVDGEVGEFVATDIDLGPELARLLPRRWMN